MDSVTMQFYRQRGAMTKPVQFVINVDNVQLNKSTKTHSPDNTEQVRTMADKIR